MTNLNKKNQADFPIYFDDFRTKRSWTNKKTDKMFNFSPNPATNITETPTYFLLEMSVPGVYLDEIEIEIVENGLEVKFEAPKNFLMEGMERVWTKEFESKNFKRRFQINPELIDFEKTEAGIDMGILHILLPKSEKAKGKWLPGFLFSDN